MVSDWDFINEHMGGHDAEGMPNFIHDFSDEGNNSWQEKDGSPYRRVEEYSCWIGPHTFLADQLGLSVNERLVLESLRTLTLSLKDHSDSACFWYEEELRFYETDKAEFERGESDFYADDLLEKKALVDEKELAYEIAVDEFMAIENAYYRTRWLAEQPAEAKTVLTAESKYPLEGQRQVVEIRAPSLDLPYRRPTYPLFVATSIISMNLNRELLIEAIRLDKRALNFANGSLKADRELVLEAVKNCGSAIEYASDALKADREVVFEAVKNDAYALRYDSALKHASDNLKADREFVFELVKLHGLALDYASDALKEDRELVLEAIKNGYFSLNDASDALKNDREIVFKLIKVSGRGLEYASDALKADRELVLEAVKKLGSELRYASDALRGDRELVLEAVKNCGWALKYASDILKADQELQNIEANDIPF